jgi:hypothetical protein
MFFFARSLPHVVCTLHAFEATWCSEQEVSEVCAQGRFKKLGLSWRLRAILALEAEIVLTAGRFVAAHPDDERVDLGAVEIEDDRGHVATTRLPRSVVNVCAVAC